MKSIKDFYKDYIFMVKQHITKLKDKQGEIDDIDQKIEFGIYDNTKLNNDKKSRIRELSDLHEEFNKEIEILCDDYIKELQKADTLRGDELTDDVNLLNSNIKLSQKDLMVMLERNKGNNTMQKVIHQYGVDNKINIGVYENPYQAKIDYINTLPYTAKTVEKWFDKQSVYDELLGDNSESTLYCNTL